VEHKELSRLAIEDNRMDDSPVGLHTAIL